MFAIKIKINYHESIIYQFLNFDGCDGEKTDIAKFLFLGIRKHAHHGWHVGLRKSGQVDL